MFNKDNTKELDIVADNLGNFGKAIVDFIQKVMAFFETIKALFAAEEEG